tara:strand:- start:811 stop:1023 length:213 start_codon:yes stop_codon:yes gene_type:complete
MPEVRIHIYEFISHNSGKMDHSLDPLGRPSDGFEIPDITFDEFAPIACQVSDGIPKNLSLENSNLMILFQ